MRHDESSLTRERERELVIAGQAGDRRARDRVISGVMRMARQYALKRTHGKVDEDVMQAALLGLCVAFDKFDVERGHRFSTFAMWHVRNEVGRAMSERRGDLISATNELARRVIREWSKDKTASHEAIVAAVGEVRVETVEAILLAYNARPRGDMDMELFESSARTDERVDLASGALLVNQVLACLGDRAAAIIWERHMRDEPRTQGDVAADLGLSQTYVGKIERAALEKLRKFVKGRV